jgi:hypothetical protein
MVTNSAVLPNGAVQTVRSSLIAEQVKVKQRRHIQTVTLLHHRQRGSCHFIPGSIS